MTMSLLSIQELHTYYGHVHALKGITLEVREGEIVSLIGANGAGKSTTLRGAHPLWWQRNPGRARSSDRRARHLPGT